MTLILKQSTSIIIRIGPFVDATDAVAPETSVTLGGADQAEVLKFNGASTVTMGGTFAAISGADGWYDYTVATGDVDTVGEVVFVVQDSSVCLPVFVRGMVVEEAVYDNIYLAAATAPATEAKQDLIQTDLNTLTDARGEPSQGAPGVSVSFLVKIDHLYQAWRNKTTGTATLHQVFDDAGSGLVTKRTVSDDGTTYTEEEWITGA